MGLGDKQNRAKVKFSKELPVYDVDIDLDENIGLKKARKAPVRRSLPYIGTERIRARKDLSDEEKKALIDQIMEKALKEFSEQEAARKKNENS